jgi:hypothetical protein
MGYTTSIAPADVPTDAKIWLGFGSAWGEINVLGPAGAAASVTTIELDGNGPATGAAMRPRPEAAGSYRWGWRSFGWA